MQKLIISLLFGCLFWLSCNTTKSTIATNLPTDNISTIINDYEALGKQISEEYAAPWPNLSAEKSKQALAGYTKILTRLAEIDVHKLTASDKINHNLLQLILKDRIYLLDFESHLFPLNSEGGFLAGVVYSLQNQQVTNEEDFERFQTKLNALPAYFQTRMDQMQIGQAKGKSSPKLVVENCIKLIDGVLNTPKEDLFFLNAVKGNAGRTTVVSDLLDHKILPAYREFRSFLAYEYLGNAPQKVGITGITDGKAFYEQRVQFFTTFDISPKEVFDIGQAEVKRIRGEMQQIIDELGFKGSFADFLVFLRTDPQFYPKTPKALLQQAAWITSEMQGKLPQYFGKLPRMPLTVTPVPAALAPNYTGGRYSPGSYAGKKSGEYWVNTYKLESRPYYVLPALSLHEGVPGHHLQMMLSAEMENIPTFRQQTYLSAFGEGWGLYAEFLGKEAGMYKTPYEDFGRLTYEMWRACRLVVDPGMHYMDWTRAQAVQFMSENTALSLHEVNTEIDRYIGWPAQAVSYKIGELKIRELRKLAESELGSKFDLAAFHDKILENGSVPLSTLETIIQQYITLAKAKN
ncbi:MAG: DUF885 family protein [Saprospiraceae bacterium]